MVSVRSSWDRIRVPACLAGMPRTLKVSLWTANTLRRQVRSERVVGRKPARICGLSRNSECISSRRLVPAAGLARCRSQRASTVPAAYHGGVPGKRKRYSSCTRFSARAKDWAASGGRPMRTWVAMCGGVGAKREGWLQGRCDKGGRRGKSTPGVSALCGKLCPSPGRRWTSWTARRTMRAEATSETQPRAALAKTAVATTPQPGTRPSPRPRRRGGRPPSKWRFACGRRCRGSCFTRLASVLWPTQQRRAEPSASCRPRAPRGTAKRPYRRHSTVSLASRCETARGRPQGAGRPGRALHNVPFGCTPPSRLHSPHLA